MERLPFDELCKKSINCIWLARQGIQTKIDSSCFIEVTNFYIIHTLCTKEDIIFRPEFWNAIHYLHERFRTPSFQGTLCSTVSIPLGDSMWFIARVS